MLYRDHKGGLSESMRTVVEVDTREELEAHVRKKFPDFRELIIEPYGFDDRIMWDTYIVVIRYENDPVKYPVGFINGQFW